MRQFSAGKADFLRKGLSLKSPARAAERDVSSACPHARDDDGARNRIVNWLLENMGPRPKRKYVNRNFQSNVNIA
jgi:hypothetical protein